MNCLLLLQQSFHWASVRQSVSNVCGSKAPSRRYGVMVGPAMDWQPVSWDRLQHLQDKMAWKMNEL